MEFSQALTGIGLILFIAVALEKFIDAIKLRVTEYIPDGIEHWFWSLFAVILGLGVAFGIAPLKFFELFGVTGVVWWFDKIIAGIAIGLGSSFLFDMLDTDNRPGVK
jgi:hypothetical protein